MTVATLTDLKVHLDIPDAANDNELQNVLDAAIEMVEGIVGPVQGTTVTDEIHYGDGSNILMLQQAPVLSVTTLAIRSGVTDTPLDVGRYTVDPATGILRLIDGTRFFGTYAVTYATGRQVVPAAIQLATLVIADQLWESQRVPGASRFGARGEATPRGFALPNRALELLAPYRGPAIA